jgi:hypothetical protein
VAVRATRTGAVREFLRLGKSVIDASNTSDLAAYEAWAEKKRRLAQEEESGSLPADPTRRLKPGPSCNNDGQPDG